MSCQLLCRHKCRHRVINMNNAFVFGSFSPLVFSTTGGLGSTATVVFKRLASLIADKQEQPYSKTQFWLRCRLVSYPDPNVRVSIIA